LGVRDEKSGHFPDGLHCDGLPADIYAFCESREYESTERGASSGVEIYGFLQMHRGRRGWFKDLRQATKEQLGLLEELKQEA